MQVGRYDTMDAQVKTSVSYYLAGHAYCVESADGAVLFDARQGNYVALDVSSMAILRTRVVNWPICVHLQISESIDVLATAELLIIGLLRRELLTTQRPNSPRTPHTAPAVSVMPWARFVGLNGRAPFHRLRFLLSILQVRLRYRRNRIEPFLDWLRDSQAKVRRGNVPPATDNQNLLATFCSMRIWVYTARERCLLDSMVLAVFLTRSRVPCRFVIGVATKPFSAHAWVEMDGAVANDVIDHVQDYLPILWTE